MIAPLSLELLFFITQLMSRSTFLAQSINSPMDTQSQFRWLPYVTQLLPTALHTNPTFKLDFQCLKSPAPSDVIVLGCAARFNLPTINQAAMMG
jgi:hypothetical protein